MGEIGGERFLSQTDDDKSAAAVDRFRILCPEKFNFHFSRREGRWGRSEEEEKFGGKK
jgi:hypothetical protein